jgi:hypothetical protein
MTQHEAVIRTLEGLSGVATLGRLNQEVFKIKDCQWGTKTPFASIRRIVQTNPGIFKIKPGLYGLIKYRKELESRGIIAESKKKEGSSQQIEFSHSYYQGLIVTVGNMKGFDTVVPAQDRNRMFVDTKLADITSLRVVPPFSFPELVKRSSSIDVMWFNERRLPHSFFEVEHSTDIHNSLLKFNELQDFSARMVIVADTKREREFRGKIAYASFKDIKTRVKFLNYQALNRHYEALLGHQESGFSL